MKNMRTYILLTPLFISTLTTYGMEEEQKNWKKKAKCFRQLATKPNKTFRITGNNSLSQDEIRKGLISLLDAMSIQENEYSSVKYIDLDMRKVDSSLFKTLVADPIFPENVKPKTIGFINTTLKCQKDTEDFGKKVAQAITIHNRDPHQPSLTLDCEQFKPLFQIPFYTVKFEYPGQEELKKQLGDDAYNATHGVVEKVLDVLSYKDTDKLGELTVTVNYSELKVKKIVPQKPTLLQRLTDPVTLCATGAGMGITALCFWLMMQQEAE